jgi:hypothetical protein
VPEGNVKAGVPPPPRGGGRQVTPGPWHHATGLMPVTHKYYLNIANNHDCLARQLQDQAD